MREAGNSDVTFFEGESRTGNALELLELAATRHKVLKDLNMSYFLCGGKGPLDVSRVEIVDTAALIIDPPKGILLSDPDTEAPVWLILPLEARA